MTHKGNSAQHQLLDQLVEEIKKNLVEGELDTARLHSNRTKVHNSLLLVTVLNQKQ